MNAREWKPGDVAIVSDPVYGDRVSVFIGHEPATRCWHGALPNGDLRCLAADQVLGARPIVVIDPEDRAQVERLSDVLRAHGLAFCNVDDITRALRSLPKPTEPTALGAVVEDANGVRWTRVESGEAVTRNPWYPAGDTNLQPAEYADIDAARKLSEGIQ